MELNTLKVQPPVYFWRGKRMKRFFRMILLVVMACVLAMPAALSEKRTVPKKPSATGGLLFPVSKKKNEGRKLVQMDGDYCHTVGLFSDGTVVAVGDNTDGECNVSEWTDIVSIAAGEYFTAGLKKDGTVLVTGKCYTYEQEKFTDARRKKQVAGWTDIVAISRAPRGPMGLKSDGTVVAAGYDTSKWKNIVKIAGSDSHIVGLKSDGTVVVIGGDFGQAKVQNWKDIVDIAAGWNTTVGLKKDGTVVAVGFNEDGACNTKEIKNIVAISASYHTTCLKVDGTVEAVGYNHWGECDISDWTDIIAISNMLYSTLALKKDGSVVVAGDYNYHGQLNFGEWFD